MKNRHSRLEHLESSTVDMFVPIVFVAFRPGYQEEDYQRQIDEFRRLKAGLFRPEEEEEKFSAIKFLGCQYDPLDDEAYEDYILRVRQKESILQCLQGAWWKGQDE